MALLTCLIGAAFLAEAAAQPAPASGEPVIDEILVTGERVPRTLRETPSSVAVFTARMIEDQPGADRLEDVLEQIPNVQFGTAGQGPTIRGQDSTGVLQDLPAFLGGTRPRVTLQVDGRAVGFNEFVFGATPLWDVERIEVFRSPQTTTQGRNAIGGAIFVETRDPTYDWQVAARAITATGGQGQVSGALSGPLIEGRLAFRIAGDLRRGRPSSKLADHDTGADPNSDDYEFLRFKLLAEPDFLPGARVEAGYTRSGSSMPQVEGVRAPFKERRDPVATYGTFVTRVDAMTASLDLPVAPLLNARTTLSRGRSRARRFAPVGLGQADNRVGDFSAESVWSWRPRSSFHLTAGIHYLEARLDQSINLTAVLGLGEFIDKQRSLGLFGEVAVRPLPRLLVTAGLRDQHDRQDRRGLLGQAPSGGPIDYLGRSGAWLPKISVAYDLGRGITAGVLVQRAYNPGGVTLNFDTGEQLEFEPESLWSKELFARASLAGGRLLLSANAFHNVFRDAQRGRSRAFQLPGGPTAFWAEIDNVPKAWTYGLESSLDWRTSDRLRLRFGLGLLKTRIVEAAPGAPQYEGKSFQRAPSLTASGAIEWEPVDRLRMSASMRYHGRYFSDDLNSPALGIDAATQVDARAAYDFGSATLFGYVRNLLDEFSLKSLSSPVFGTANDPQEVGIGLQKRF